jgi:hypothetical protein
MARKIRQQVCANCKHTFNEGENFCPNCGQENHSPNQPIKHYASELIESLLHLDSKILYTVKTMLMYPGKITREYNDNMRARYTPPVRLYVFISLIFFVLIQIPTKNERMIINTRSNTSTDQDSISLLTDALPGEKSSSKDSIIKINLLGINLRMTQAELEQFKRGNPEDLDSLITTSHLNPNYFTRTFFKQIIKSLNSEDNFEERLKEKCIKFGSLSLFLLMPYFALLLSLAYYRRKNNYYEYLIFSIHYHTVVFLILSLILIINIILILPEWVYIILVINLFYYLGKSLRLNFEGSRKRTILKIALISLFYWICLMIVAIVVLLLGWWFV